LLGAGLRDFIVNDTIMMHANWNNAHLRIPARYIHQRANTIDMRFAAPTHRRAPASSAYRRQEKPNYLYGLLVPMDANQPSSLLPAWR
jgi:hypothetical protein